MKQATRIVALLLTLTICILAFASCGKKKDTTVSTTAAAAGGTTAQATNAEPTTAEPTSPAPTQPPHVHVPEDHYEIDLPPTCSTTGEKSLYCAECGDLIEGSTVSIPIDPDAHKVDEWITVEPTVIKPEGSRTGTCVICDALIEETLTFEPIVFASNWDDSTRSDYNTEHHVDWLNHHDLPTGIYIRKNINSIKDADTHYYPTEENPLGNDLLVEVSYLWNETMTSGKGYTGEPLTFANGDGFDVFHVGAKLDAKDNRKINNVLCKYTYIYPTPDEISGNAALKTPSIGEYGWHRLGFRVHQEAAIVEGAVKYTYIASAYLDGTMVLSFELSDWVVRYFDKTVTGLLFTAAIDPEDDTNLLYYDIGSNPASGYTNSYGLFIVEEFFNSTGTAYVVLGDLSMTCGNEFVQEVVPNANPDDATFEIATGVEVPAKIWYKFPVT